MSAARKIWELLTPPQRRAAAVLLVLMLIGMVLETLGIGLVIPALGLMTQGDLATKYPAFAPVLRTLGNPSRERLIVIAMLTMVAASTLKAVFLAVLTWRAMSFVNNVQADLAHRLFAGYLRQPYVFHLQRNSAQLIRNIVNETYILTQSGFTSGLTLLTETFVLLGVGALLIAIEPVGALSVAATLAISGWAIVRLPRHRILRWGEQRQYHEGQRLQHLQQGLGSVKDIKLLGREEDFLGQHHVHSLGMARLGQRQGTLQQIPRIALEFIAIIGLAALVLTMLAQGKPVEKILPSLGLFAVAAFRFLPSVTRVIYAFHAVRYGMPAVNTLHEELRSLAATNVPLRAGALPFTSELTLDRVSFRYPSVSSEAVSDISLAISRGSSVGFIGGSGAGKSTLIDVILGLLTPAAGSIKVDGVDIQGDLRTWQDQIGYVPQFIFLTDDTLRRNVAFGIPDTQIDEAAVWRAIKAAQLDQFVVNELSEGIETMVGERGVRLSGGQRQRIGIARALYHDPSVLVLDEATSSLDTATEAGVMDAVRALKGDKTLIIVAHRLSTVEQCDRLFRLDQGRIVEQGETALVLRKAARSAS